MILTNLLVPVLAVGALMLGACAPNYDNGNSGGDSGYQNTGDNSGGQDASDDSDDDGEYDQTDGPMQTGDDQTMADLCTGNGESYYYGYCIPQGTQTRIVDNQVVVVYPPGYNHQHPGNPHPTVQVQHHHGRANRLPSESASNDSGNNSSGETDHHVQHHHVNSGESDNSYTPRVRAREASTYPKTNTYKAYNPYAAAAVR